MMELKKSWLDDLGIRAIQTLKTGAFIVELCGSDVLGKVAVWVSRVRDGAAFQAAKRVVEAWRGRARNPGLLPRLNGPGQC
jgi:hypothetical protein